MHIGNGNDNKHENGNGMVMETTPATERNGKSTRKLSWKGIYLSVTLPTRVAEQCH